MRGKSSEAICEKSKPKYTTVSASTSKDNPYIHDCNLMKKSPPLHLHHTVYHVYINPPVLHLRYITQPPQLCTPTHTSTSILLERGIPRSLLQVGLTPGLTNRGHIILSIDQTKSPWQPHHWREEEEEVGVFRLSETPHYDSAP